MMLVLISVHSLARRMGSAYILTLRQQTSGLAIKTPSVTLRLQHLMAELVLLSFKFQSSTFPTRYLILVPKS